MKRLTEIDWNSVLKRYANPQAVKDLDKFLDAMPLNVGYNALIAAGMAWVLAGTAVFFTTMAVEDVSRLRTELAKVESLQPPVPVIEYVPVAGEALTAVQDKIKATYNGINFTGSADSLTVSASDTDFFPQFLAAVSTLQNGGKNWRLSVTSLCVGRDCQSSKLSATLKVEMARVGDPPPQEEEPPPQG